MQKYFINMIIYSFYDIFVMALALKAQQTESKVDDSFVSVLQAEKESIIKEIVEKF